MSSHLVLEQRISEDETGVLGNPVTGAVAALLAPMVDEDYWEFRVKLGDKGQAILGFWKFGMIGCGFAIEEDENTNLPVPGVPAERVFEHIIHNKGDDSIPDADVLEAIRMVSAAAQAIRDGNEPKTKETK